eukprot:scaffold185026_cov18-Tisochrysis_lutea.AAC.1
MFKAGALPRRRAAAGAYAAGTEQGNAAAATSLVEPAPAVLALAACSRKHAVAHPTCARQWRIRHAHGELPFVRPQAHVVLVLLLSGAAGAGVLPCVPPQEHVVLSLAHSAVGYAEEEQAAARLDLAVCRAHEGVTLQLGEAHPQMSLLSFHEINQNKACTHITSLGSKVYSKLANSLVLNPDPCKWLAQKPGAQQ